MLLDNLFVDTITSPEIMSKLTTTGVRMMLNKRTRRDAVLQRVKQILLTHRIYQRKKLHPTSDEMAINDEMLDYGVENWRPNHNKIVYKLSTTDVINYCEDCPVIGFVRIAKGADTTVECCDEPWCHCSRGDPYITVEGIYTRMKSTYSTNSYFAHGELIQSDSYFFKNGPEKRILIDAKISKYLIPISSNMDKIVNKSKICQYSSHDDYLRPDSNWRYTNWSLPITYDTASTYNMFRMSKIGDFAHEFPDFGLKIDKLIVERIKQDIMELSKHNQTRLALMNNKILNLQPCENLIQSTFNWLDTRVGSYK